MLASDAKLNADTTSALATVGEPEMLGRMPRIFHQPHDRRAFLRTAVLGGAALVARPSGILAQPSAGTRSGELPVALLSDTHLPGDRLNEYRGFKPWENLKAVVPDVAAVEPEWALINGDAARLAGLPEDYAELRTLLEPLSKQVPIVIGLGNHDDRTNFAKEFTDPAGTRPDIRGKHVTVIEHDTVRIVALDSLLYVNKTAGLLGREQRNWLAINLARMADRPAVLVVHHTLGDGDGDLLDVDRLFALLRPHGHVKAIFYGHSHVWNRQEREGIQLINLPAVGYNFRDQDPVGWVQAWFHARGVRLKLRAFAGNRERDGEVVEIPWA